MRAICAAVAVSVTLLAGCEKKETKAEPNLLTNNNSGNPLTAPVDYLGAVNQARKGAVNTIDKAGLTKHIETFNAQEERFPRDLNELVQKGYIQAIPAPPQGMRFDYSPQTGELKIVPQ
jgi:outer membrane murein-binding lipoprotein Lpp